MARSEQSKLMFENICHLYILLNLLVWKKEVNV